MNNKKISCEAKNNDINQPKTRTVTIQMNCKCLLTVSFLITLFSVRPQSVKILRKEAFLTEGTKVQVVCEVSQEEEEEVVMTVSVLGERE